ncbi:hypothetical protein MGYG_03909 [Nannizzia gypsea CBS 118893]|uniref:Uncharacterized protein n=1 Tax=Arthroderma gypseum (strain ATCC MYA-4604 / CBS 118893) TaxID=535722 RepID=E4UUD9_ARTGP|nr:hypothetical protein MGYG_03909 [Nannizzia gypsea CBS 118893]EFR00906.1 hypothetical protein MGYG_03909 [Nannizzia gypsea CBS 118893]
MRVRIRPGIFGIYPPRHDGPSSSSGLLGVPAIFKRDNATEGTKEQEAGGMDRGIKAALQDGLVMEVPRKSMGNYLGISKGNVKTTKNEPESTGTGYADRPIYRPSTEFPEIPMATVLLRKRKVTAETKNPKIYREIESLQRPYGQKEPEIRAISQETGVSRVKEWQAEDRGRSKGGQKAVVIDS